MQRLGIHAIKRSGPGVYDRNILAVAAQHNMQVHYSFWVPEITDVVKEMPVLSRLAQQIITTVEKLKEDKSIVAWNIGDTLWQQLGERFYKPSLLYQQQAYITWLKKLVIRIKAIDPTRPVTMDVGVNNRLATTIQLLQQQLTEIDAFGLIINRDTSGLAQISQLQAPCFISQVSVPDYLQLADRRMGAFINAWQDAGERDYLSFDGMVDHWGRRKPAYYQLGQRWAKLAAAPSLPMVKILRPAKLTKLNNSLTYRALVRREQQWALATTIRHNLKFEWRLVKTDEWGNAVFMRSLGRGTAVTVNIPKDPSTYRLYLVASKGEDIVTAEAILNTPTR
jgi:hypothetical protein